MRKFIIVLIGFAGAAMLSGCLVRTYPLERERIDQDITTGNRGFLQGSAPAAGERKSTRMTRVVEVESGKQWKFESRPAMSEKEPAAGPALETGADWSYTIPDLYEAVDETPAVSRAVPDQEYRNYTVQKGDTLQKISNSFYGTTKKWYKIYEANKDTLKTPDKLYPGKTIRIPVAAGTEGPRKIK